MRAKNILFFPPSVSGVMEKVRHVLCFAYMALAISIM